MADWDGNGDGKHSTDRSLRHTVSPLLSRRPLPNQPNPFPRCMLILESIRQPGFWLNQNRQSRHRKLDGILEYQRRAPQRLQTVVHAVVSQDDDGRPFRKG